MANAEKPQDTWRIIKHKLGKFVSTKSLGAITHPKFCYTRRKIFFL